MKKNTNLMMSLLIAAFATVALYGADPQPHKDHGDDPLLPAGEYSARVKALACETCAPLIEKTLRKLEAIGPVHVDTKESRVHFSVKKGAAVQWSTLQAALKKSADQMGMGADFSLSDFRAGQSKKVAPHADQSLSSGYYDAKVGAIVCGGCKDLIERTIRSVDGVGAAQVESKTGSVRFTVIAGKTVQLSKLQAALKTAAEQMGMGADYSLSGTKSVKKI